MYLQLASALNSDLNAIPFYKFWSLMLLLPSQEGFKRHTIISSGFQI